MLMDNARQRPADLFAALDIRLHKRGRRWTGRCPIHDGDGFNSFHFFPDGEKNKAFWLCYSNHCEHTFGGSLLGFVQAALSHQQKGWSCHDDNRLIVPKQEAIDWLCEFTGLDWDNIKPDLGLASRNEFTSAVESLILPACHQVSAICSTKQLSKWLEMPPEYFLSRGFSAETLQYFNIGLNNNPSSPTYGRVVVPFLTDDGHGVIGCIARSVYEKCPKCPGHHHIHDACCDDHNFSARYAKWLCSDKFMDKNHLYNYWNAVPHILNNRRTLIIVEGCGDVWRLHEAGLFNAVAINGSDITGPQEVAIECSGCTRIICLTDNDKAGNQAFESIKKKCPLIPTKRVNPPSSVKDVGELQYDDPFFQSIKDLCQNKLF